jgi:aminoglycoside 6'-N-acetyltransferase
MRCVGCCTPGACAVPDELRGRRVTLRAPGESDLEVLLRVRNDEALQRQLMADYRPNDLARVREWLDKRAGEPDTLFFVIADNRSGACLGFIQLLHMNRETGTGHLGICVEPSSQGHGVGGEALALLERHAQAAHGIRTVELEVLADNAPALRLYARAGFKPVGGSDGVCRMQKERAT